MDDHTKQTRTEPSGDIRVRTGRPQDDQAEQRLPHERDESEDSQSSKPRGDMLQAKKDIESGQVDTDCRNVPGVQSAVNGGATGGACPVREGDTKTRQSH